MKKKFIMILLAIIMMLPCAFSLVGCDLGGGGTMGRSGETADNSNDTAIKELSTLGITDQSALSFEGEYFPSICGKIEIKFNAYSLGITVYYRTKTTVSGTYGQWTVTEPELRAAGKIYVEVKLVKRGYNDKIITGLSIEITEAQDAEVINYTGAGTEATAPTVTYDNLTNYGINLDEDDVSSIDVYLWSGAEFSDYQTYYISYNIENGWLMQNNYGDINNNQMLVNIKAKNNMVVSIFYHNGEVGVVAVNLTQSGMDKLTNLTDICVDPYAD